MKPYKGKLDLWIKQPCSKEEGGLGYYYEGIFEGHPQFDGKRGWTSYVVKKNGPEIETRNSRYTLGEPLPSNMAWINDKEETPA